VGERKGGRWRNREEDGYHEGERRSEEDGRREKKMDAGA
jgi:hypothetical protein